MKWLIFLWCFEICNCNMSAIAGYSVIQLLNLKVLFFLRWAHNLTRLWGHVEFSICLERICPWSSRPTLWDTHRKFESGPKEECKSPNIHLFKTSNKILLSLNVTPTSPIIQIHCVRPTLSPTWGRDEWRTFHVLHAAWNVHNYNL